MANTTLLTRDVEDWVRTDALPVLYPGHTFASTSVPLLWGGNFAVDAVSGAVAICISTGGGTKAGQVNKIYKDALMLTGLAGEWQQRVLAFTEEVLFDYFKEQSRRGRFPPQIELLHIPLSGDLRDAVVAVRRAASLEVWPVQPSTQPAAVEPAARPGVSQASTAPGSRDRGAA